MHQTKTNSPATRQANLAPDDGLFELAGTKPAWIWAHTCPMPDCSCRTALILATDMGREHLLERGAAVRDAWKTNTDHSSAAATLGEMCDALKPVYGVYQEPAF